MDRAALKLGMPFVGVALLVFAIVVNTTLNYPEASIALFSLSGIVLLVWTLKSRALFKRMAVHRGLKIALSSGVSSVLVLVVVLGIGMLLEKPRFNKTWDVTRDGVNTLAPQTHKVIQAFNSESRKTDILAFFENEGEKAKFRDLLLLYESAGLRTHVEYVDPAADPTRAIAEKITLSNTVILKDGGQDARVTSFTEEKMTNALIKLQKKEVKTIAFTKGHGEAELRSDEGDGLGIISQDLESSSYQVIEQSLLERSELTASEVNLVAIIGPKYDFQDAEIGILDAYISSGGALLVMIDALVKAPRLQSFLMKHGIKLQNDLLILSDDDPRGRLLGQNNAIVSEFDAFNPVTKDFADNSGVALISSFTRSVSESESGQANLKVSVVGKTGGGILGINGVQDPKDLKDVDQEDLSDGPFGVIAVATGMSEGENLASADGHAHHGHTKVVSDPPASTAVTPAKKTRIVVMGSSNFATNAGVQRVENFDLVMNAFNFLIADESLIALRPKDSTKTRLDVSSPASQFHLLIISYLVPFLFLGGGVYHWLRRRAV